MKYYKIIHRETGTPMCYTKGDSDYGASEVCAILGVNKYTFKEISKEEYEQEADDMEGEADEDSEEDF